jgi:hypothetical protein
MVSAVRIKEARGHLGNCRGPRSRSQAQNRKRSSHSGTCRIGGLDHNQRLIAEAELKLWVQAGAERRSYKSLLLVACKWRAESV